MWMKLSTPSRTPSPDFPYRRHTLSHIVTVNTEIRDHTAVAAACRRHALPEPAQGTAQLYSGQVSGLLVRLPAWLYPVVIDTATGTIRFDNFGGAWGEEKHLHRLLRAYAVERPRGEARKKCYATTETSLAEGSSWSRSGWEARHEADHPRDRQPDGRDEGREKGFSGGECREASRFIEQALGQPAGEPLTAEFYQA
jgi:hypothetical protein